METNKEVIRASKDAQFINSLNYEQTYLRLVNYQMDLKKEIRQSCNKCKYCFYMKGQKEENLIYRPKECFNCSGKLIVSHLSEQNLCEQCASDLSLCKECMQTLD